MAICMMWNLRETCIYAETLFEICFRHSLRVAKADMVFVLPSSTEHYVAAGKHLHIFHKGTFGKCLQNAWVFFMSTPFLPLTLVSVVSVRTLMVSAS